MYLGSVTYPGTAAYPGDPGYVPPPPPPGARHNACDQTRPRGGWSVGYVRAGHTATPGLGAALVDRGDGAADLTVTGSGGATASSYSSDVDVHLPRARLTAPGPVTVSIDVGVDVAGPASGLAVTYLDAADTRVGSRTPSRYVAVPTGSPVRVAVVVVPPPAAVYVRLEVWTRNATDTAPRRLTVARPLVEAGAAARSFGDGDTAGWAVTGPAGLTPSIGPPLDTAGLDHRFYVGPVGRLRPLPDVDGPVATPLDVVGGTHTSLMGASTRDVLAAKRSWTWEYPLLTARQARHVEAITSGLVRGPLFVVDPRRPNRLPEQIATGGSATGAPDGFIPTNNAVCRWRALSSVPADVDTLEPADVIDGCVELVLLDPGAVGVELAGRGPDGRHRTPLLGGETITLSAAASGPSAAAVGVWGTVFAASGQPLVAVDGDYRPCRPDRWTTTDVTVEVPDRGATLDLRLVTDPFVTLPAGSVWLTALQVAVEGDPTDVPRLLVHCADDTAGGYGDPPAWWIGGGAVEVVVAGAGDPSYPLPGLYGAGLTLTER